MNIHYDQDHGIGQTPYNLQVDYRGFKCWMYPDMFLKIARRIFIDPKDAYFLMMKNAIRKGKPIGSPFFNASWDDTKQVWELTGHEGRHRVQAIKELWPNEPVEVHIIPLGGIRAKDITPQMLQSFIEGVIAEDDTYVEKPTSKIEWQGKTVAPQSQQPQQPQPPMPMMESNLNHRSDLNRKFKNNYSISKLEEVQAVQFISKKLIPKLVSFRNTHNKSGITNVKDVTRTLKKIEQNNTRRVIAYKALFQKEPYIFNIFKNLDNDLFVRYAGDDSTYKVI